VGFEKIDFESMGWAPGAHPFEKKKAAAGATLLSFEPGFVDPAICRNGHTGYVLDGTLRFELDEGVVDLEAGSAFVIDPGTGHRASNPGPTTVRLFIVPLAPRPLTPWS
jgi:quercetin dioxygenase-like cupin family protein